MELLPKFILIKDQIIIGKCNFHRELHHEEKEILGGGWWHLDRDTSSFYLYGTSDQFGSCDEDDIVNCLHNGNVGERHRLKKYANYSFYFSVSLSITEALKQTKRIIKI